MVPAPPKPFYSVEPQVRFADYCFSRWITWEELDRKASEILKTPCLAIPSVRVGMNWTLQFKGFARHRDHVLVPKFLGRCILNALNRQSFPVETPTSATRMLVVIHQFGLIQDMDAIAKVCADRGWDYIEDSPSGIADVEKPGPGSLAKFIALSKVLPLLQGAVALTPDTPLRNFLIAKRREYSPWSWITAGLMALAKCRAQRALGSATAEMASTETWLTSFPISRHLSPAPIRRTQLAAIAP